MTVSAKKLGNRDVYEFTYNGAENRAGGIVATFTNAEGDESEYKGLDDGKFVSTVDAGYAGEADVEILDADGNAIDEGAVTFG